MSRLAACSTRRRSEQGSALAMVLWISFGLVAIALYFGQSMSLEIKAATNAEAGAQAEQAIEGAARFLKVALASLPEPGQLPDTTDLPREAVAVGEAMFWIVGRDPSGEDQTTPWFDLVDEAGKLHLNTATAAMLAKLPGMTEDLAAAIVDWRDTNDDTTEGGAESDVYLRSTSPYVAKNAPFESVEELRLVYGFTEEILLGEDANRNGILDPNEDDGDLSPPYDNADGRLDRGLLDLVTVHSREPTTQTNGEPRINLVPPPNSGAAGRAQVNQQLRTYLTDVLGEDRANEIMGRVSNTSLTSPLDFHLRSGMKLDEFAKVDDALTISTNVVQGLVNVNTASVDVLATLTGLEYADAQSLVTYRTRNTGVLNTVGWVGEVLTEEKARRIGPLITDKGYHYTADLCAVGRGGRGFRRSVMVFDLSENTPKVVYRRELNRTGWALGLELRQQLAALMEQAQ